MVSRSLEAPGTQATGGGVQQISRNPGAIDRDGKASAFIGGIN